MSTEKPALPLRLTPEELRARSRRNLWIALALVAFVVLVFLTTALRLLSNQAEARKAEAEAAALVAEPAVLLPAAKAAP